MGWILTALAVSVFYAIECRFWPYTRCSRCGGRKHFDSPSGWGFRLCGKCGGSGHRLRWGVRLYRRWHE